MGTPSEFARVCRDAWQEANKLATKVAPLCPPSPLHFLAKELRVTALRFEPLLSDAGLASHTEGFEIVVNTDGPWTRFLGGLKLPTDDERWLELEPPLRFTIAHELAHILILNAAGGDHNRDLFRRNEQAIENGCNVLARILVLPEEVLTGELKNDLSDLDHISALIDRSRVSPEVFIRRLNIVESSVHSFEMDGFLALARQEDNGIRVKAAHVTGDLAVSRFHTALSSTRKGHNASRRSLPKEYTQSHWALEGVMLHDISKDLESALKEGTHGTHEIEVPWSKAKVIRCRVTYVRRAKRALDCLLLVQIVGTVEDRIQETLL